MVDGVDAVSAQKPCFSSCTASKFEGASCSLQDPRRDPHHAAGDKVTTTVGSQAMAQGFGTSNSHVRRFLAGEGFESSVVQGLYESELAS